MKTPAADAGVLLAALNGGVRLFRLNEGSSQTRQTVMARGLIQQARR